MVRSRGDASDDSREGAEAQRAKEALVDPDRALEQRRAAAAVRRADDAVDHGGARESAKQHVAERAGPQEGRTVKAERPKAWIETMPDRSGAVRAGETREQYMGRLGRELREGPERLNNQWHQADERARFERTGGGSERRTPLESRGPADVPGDHQKPERVRGEAQGQGDHVWVDRGVVDTKLGRIDRREYADVWESQKTHKYSKEDIDASLKSLPEVRSRLGKGTSREELRALAASTDPKERQIGRTYMTYYESDPIKVDLSTDGRSSVSSGRHRLAQAEQLGMEDVPMRVSEQTRREKDGER